MEAAPDTVAMGSSPAAAIANSPPPFLSKTYDMVDDPSTGAIVSWSKSNNSFVVWNVPEFARDLLPKYFKHNNFSSFVRQLNTYGFRKVDPDRWEFANEGFLRGQKHLLKIINRRKPVHVHAHQQPPQVQDKSVKSCVEIGKFGIEEEVDRLKRDKNVLMQELVRLRQQQQSTDHQLHTVSQRVQEMEQRQQQMMSFLAKAMHSPQFLAQLVQQQNESGRRISGANKKRRLPNQEEESNSSFNHGISSPDGQIIKYQPLMSEAAEAMLRQILKTDASPRLESTVNGQNGFLIENVASSSHALDRGGSSSRVSGVAYPEALPISSLSHPSRELGMPVAGPTTTVSEIQSSPNVASIPAKAAQFPEMNINPQEDTVPRNLPQMQGIMAESTVGVSDLSFELSETGSTEYTDSMSVLIDGSVPALTDEFSADPATDMLLDEMPKLPGINDAFWEQFLSIGSLMGDTDEISSNTSESHIGLDQGGLTGQESGRDNTQHMDNLTQQMGLLAAEAKRG